MGLKTRTMDEYMTATKKSITGNDDIEECRFARSILDENSEAFALMHEKYLAGCSLGGKTTQEMRCNAGWHFNILMEDGYSREEALNWIESQMSLEHRNLYVNEERFTATSRLAAEMGRREVSDSELEKIASELDMDVHILRANVNAFRENQERFTRTSRLAAEMGRREVSESELEKIASELDMKVKDLKENAESMLRVQNKFTAFFTATNRLASEMGRRDVSEDELKEVAQNLDIEKVEDLIKHVEAFRKNQDRFTVVVRFAAETRIRDVSEDEDIAVAKRFGMKIVDLHTRVKPFTDNWDGRRETTLVFDGTNR